MKLNQGKIMTPNEIKKKVLKYKWEWWAERPFRAFIMSLFQDGQKKEYLKKIGVNAEWPALLFQKGAFYKSEDVWNKFAVRLKKYLNQSGSVYKISKSCELYGADSKKEIESMKKSDLPLRAKLKRLSEILSLDISYVWLTHGFEHLYKKRLNKEVPKYIDAENVGKFIGDISYPVKKNAHNYLEKALRNSAVSLESIRLKYGWIKARDGFSPAFTLAELAKEQVNLKKIRTKKFTRPAIPGPLKALAKVAQELVYQRTLRTDILYELMYTARPILAGAARQYGIPFAELQNYSIHDLIAGKPRRYPFLVTAISWGRDFVLLDKPILNDEYGSSDELAGVIAYRGKTKGRAKIVKTAYEIGKVKLGDILFAPTTAPSYIMGMKKAAAFVTDEGGITSHAAIVSREMKKPCIIGTKIATKVFKDGDLVEVDANKGIVRKI
ncbi:hypothetical protein D4Q76_02515 [archaeon]|nr:MAG: hypothetical protein D4Q76_02515 [archaeon]